MNYRNELTDKLLKWFQYYQKYKLNINNYKGNWRTDSLRSLFIKLEIEVAELNTALYMAEYTDPEDITVHQLEEIVRECADVANFAMFIADMADQQIYLKGEG